MAKKASKKTTARKKTATKKKAAVKKKAAKKTTRKKDPIASKAPKEDLHKRGRPRGGKIVDDEAIAFMVECVSQGMTKYAIKAALFDFLGCKIGVSAFNRAMQTVRGYLTEMIKVEEEDLRIDSLAFYMSVRGNQNEETRDRLKAAERIDSILGFDAKFKQVGGKTAQEQVERINEIRRQMRASVPKEKE